MNGLTTSHDDGVVVLTLDRPDRRNALTRELIAALDAALTAAVADDNTGCVVLTGAGSAFSSGVDLEAAVADDVPSFPDILTAITARIRTLDLPVIAAIEGPAFGAGLALALASDIRIVAEDARLCEAYVRIGRFAGGGDTYWLPQRVGAGHALRMLWTGEVISGQRAVEIGLAEEAVSAGAALQTAVILARQVAKAPSAVVSRTKHAVYSMQARSMQDALAESVALSAQQDEPGLP